MAELFALLLAVLLVSLPVSAETPPFGRAQLTVQGSRLTLFGDSQTIDWDQTVDVGEAIRIRTCYGSAGATCGSASGADPSLAGLKVLGELSGPELPQSLSFETIPGGSFFLPGFQKEGDYLLSNIRLVESATSRLLGTATPSAATIHVRQILLASAAVTRLSLADLQARGITITQESFQAFNFAVGFAFQGQTVTINLPVLFQGNGTVNFLIKPTVNLDGLPPDVQHAVRRWEPPHIIPFQLTGAPGNPQDPAKDEPEPVDPDTPLYGAIVLPGNVSFLNQFFDAKLIVASGAPSGSGATLRNVMGVLRLPGGDVLRMASTVPPVAAGQNLPILKANGDGVLGPAEQGTATWTIEGLAAGTHTLRIDVAAELNRPGRLVLPLTGVVQAAVQVVDARFHVTFNHPETVREGEAYSLFVTVMNLSRAPQNLITVSLAAENITGAHEADAGESFSKTIPTLDPGGSETLEYRLVADITGQCVATTFQSSSPGLEGSIQLRAGVGELGIPLSPASLVLPRFSNLLPQPLLTANVRLLGLAYSLAVAPASATPAGLPHVIRSDVERRAIDLGEAGQRLFLKEKLLESLEVLALDQLGNRHDLVEYDALRRALPKGAAAAAALGDAFHAEQQARNLAAVDFLDHFATTTSYGRPWIAAILTPDALSVPAPAVELRRVSVSETTSMSGTSRDASRSRGLPYGEIYALADSPGGSRMAPFAVVGRLDPAFSYRLRLSAPAGGTSAGRLVVIVPTEDRSGFRRVDFGTIRMSPGDLFEVRLAAGGGEFSVDFVFRSATSGLPVTGLPAPSVTNLTLPPFRLVGAVQDFLLDGESLSGAHPGTQGYGVAVSYLFNRPPDKASAETAPSYVIRSSFHGQDTASPAQVVDRQTTKRGTAAFLQPSSERVVNVRFDSPISPLEGSFDTTPFIRHEHLLNAAQVRDSHGTPLDPLIPGVVAESGHTGGLVEGKVLRGTGDPVAGAKIQLIRVRTIDDSLDLGTGEPIVVLDVVAEMTTGADGAFYFDFLEQKQGNVTLRATIPAGSDPVLQPAEKEEVSFPVRLLNRLAHVNIALLGRGTVKGRLLWADDRSAVAKGTVLASSTLFSEQRTVTVAADGSFTFGGLPVGPITLSGKDESRQTAVYQTVGIQRPGDLVTLDLLLPRSGSRTFGVVTGTVLRQRSGSPLPPPSLSPGAAVSVYSAGSLVAQASADANGRFRFDKVPAGRISVQAADFSVSRLPAFANAMLPADGSVSVTLTIAEAAPRTVTGRVLFHDDPSNTNIPVAGAVAFINGPGVFAYTDATGTYRIEGVPVQDASKAPYVVTAFDLTRQLQGTATLPPILDVGDGSPVVAQDIVLSRMTGGIDGVVLDSLGRPAGGVMVGLVGQGSPSVATLSDGRFALDSLPVGTYAVVAHDGDGLVKGRVGYFGWADTQIVFGGHRPFVTIRLRGSGIVNIRTRTATSTGVLTPVSWRNIYFSPNSYDVIMKGGEAYQGSTDADGRLQFILPIGGPRKESGNGFSITAASPFGGSKTVSGTLTYPGQILNFDIVYDTASSVTGHVVNVDGVTPLTNVDVTLAASGLLPQTQRTDGQGGFRFELVPQGGISVTSAALFGSVDRVGRADGVITGPGQTLDLTVRMRAQGTIRGRVFSRVGLDLQSLASASYYVVESAYPNRRLPATGTYTVDTGGAYEASHLFAGPITVVAFDRNDPTRQGRAAQEITADFQVVSMPDIVMSTSVGSIGVTVRDPDTGGPLPDSQVLLSNGDITVADQDGHASFDAEPLATYSAYAFHAPTGRGGQVNGIRLSNAGEHVEVVVYVDTRGQVSGVLWDDAAKTTPVGGGTVQLQGQVHGRAWATSISALATTSSDPATLGRFLFDGIPVGHFDLTAKVASSPRLAAASLDLTTTAPIAAVDLVLEPLGDVYVRLFENRVPPTPSELNPSTGIFSVSLLQLPGCLGPPKAGCVYDFTFTMPMTPYPGHLYRFQNVLTSRSVRVFVQESGGKQRTASGQVPSLPGSGTSSDPYRLVLTPKGSVVITVRDASGNLVSGANVTLSASGGLTFPSVTDGTGKVTFSGVPAGSLSASAKSPVSGFGGLATGTLTYEDEVVNLSVTLAPAVSARGIVYAPAPNDAWTDPSTLTPQDKAIIQFKDASGKTFVVQTGADGIFRFAVLAVGSYTVQAQDETGQAIAFGSGTLVGPDGNENVIPALVLEASAPQIVSAAPPPGQTNVSRLAAVEIVFSKRLADAVLPTGGATSPYFAVRSAAGNLGTGSWTTFVNGFGQQVVRFTPTAPYDNQSLYSVRITGSSGGVRDRVGHPLNPLSDVGWNFTTSDTVGPRVVGTVPSLDRPVDPKATLRFDFSDLVAGTAQDLDGSAPDTAAAQVLWLQNGAPQYTTVPVTLSLTRGGYSLLLQPPTGVTYTNDSLKRQVRIRNLKSATSGTAMAEYLKGFRIWDQNPPHVEASLPAGAPDGKLSPGVTYTVSPVLSNLDDTDLGPCGDVDHVDYFLASPSDPSQPVSQPVATQKSCPMAFSFVAAYAGNGVDPRPFPMWVQAVDTSTNKSNLVKLSMVVLPARPPTVSTVTPSAVSPVPGTYYAGSLVRATVAGLDDGGGAQITVTVELRKDNPGSPNNPADLVALAPSLLVFRPSSGWGSLVPPTFDVHIPLSLAEATSLFFRVKVTNALGLGVTAECARFSVAHDLNLPLVDSFVARVSGASSPASRFYIGQKVVLEFRARDTETAVRTLGLTLSGVFGSPQVATLAAGTTNLYRTAELTVPATVPPGGQAVTATASATDWGSNTGTATLFFTVSPTPDPYAPVAEWLTPWEGGAWPAAYASVVSADGAALLLRARATDLDRVSGADVPGTIVGVQFKGPADATGTLAASFVDGSLVSGTGSPGSGIYEALWRVPNGVAEGTLLPFQVRIVDTGGNVTTADVRLRAVRPRRVYEAASLAVLPSDTMLINGGAADGPVFLLDGTLLSLYPQSGGAVRSLASMVIYSGGLISGSSLTPHPSVFTAPEITSYASSVLYNPLELSITDAFGLGHGARVDVTARGLLGSTATQSMVLPGQTGAAQYAGGSHGGSGTPGSLGGGFARSDLTSSGSVYDSIKDPALAGGGAGVGSFSVAGGTGGGVIRLLAPGAVVHLAGDVLADGGDGPGGGVLGQPIGGGGAGGAIRIVAGRLEGSGSVSARGGRGTHSVYTGGGGGGRLALSFSDPPAAALALQLGAAGGLNSMPPDANASQRAGAGTIYIEETDALGVPKAPGRLVVSNGSGKPAWPTPFAGAQRFGAVEAHGTARLVFADDLTVGAVDPGVVNDRASVSLDAEARLLLTTDGPQAPITATPDGGDVNVNQTITFTWTASDPIGLSSLTTTFSPAAPATTVYDSEPLAVTQGTQPLTLTVPGAQPPGPITYSVLAADRAGRVTTVQKMWTVLPDTTPPVVNVTGLVTGGVYHAGQTISATVTATDNGAVSSVKVLLDGQTFPLAGTGPNYAFSYLVPRDLAAARDTTFQAVATDAVGNATSTTAAAIHLVLDTVPSLSLSGVTPGPSVLAGTTLAATASASDDVGVTTVVFTLSGAVVATDTRTVNALSTAQVLSYRLPVTLTAGQSVTLQVDAFDTYGHKTSAAAVTYTILADTAGPTISSVAASPAKTGDLYTSGDVVTFTVTATDNVGVATIRLTIDGQTTTYSSSPVVLVWTAPVVGGNTPFSLDVEVLDYAGNRSSASKALSVVPAGGGTYPAVSFSCPTAGAYLPSAYAGLLLSATATDTGGISKIEFYRPGDVTPFSTSTPSVGTPSPYTGTSTAVTLPTVASDTVVRYRVRAYNPSNHFTETFVDVHVVPAVDIATATSTDFAVLRSGTLTIDIPKTYAGLIVLRGATITHSAFTGTQSVNLTVNGPVYVECGGSIDVSGRGYPTNTSYPGAVTPGGATGGSHLGYGGLYSAPLGSTYGSVYRPQEAGAGGLNGGSGGGIVRIVAGSMAVDGAIRANGTSTGGFQNDHTGAGGSVWVVTGAVSGTGWVEARGGDSVTNGTGGGGAIAMEYTTSSGSVVSNLVARTGSPSTTNRYGGAGTAYLKGPTAVYGDLVVDNLGVAIQQATELPSLGSGTAQSGSSGATLVTDRASSVPAYFAGHWVEIYDSTGTTLKGTWRISTAAGGISNKTVTLVPNGTETISIVIGDKWQGVYRFDNVTMKGVRVLSTDPVRATATQIQGVVEVKRVDSDSLSVKSGATLTHLVTPVGGTAESLTVNLTGTLTVDAGGSIDVSGRGYAPNDSYPGATGPGGGSGGSHLGYGGLYNTPLGGTFGSVYRPQEAGGAGLNGGTAGGIVRVAANAVYVDGAIRADGTATGGFLNDHTGAGGSVWITAASLGGMGTIEARGGDGVSYGTGGGGAIAVEYTSASGSVLSNLLVRTGSPSTQSRYGGAGTVYLKGPAAVFGDLKVDNGGKSGQATVLPSLGTGIAQAGTSGATLVTDRSSNIPAYFAGHWVEIRDSSGATLKGTWRISTGAGGIVSKTVTFVPNGAEAISIVSGDKWQGVYRFDSAPAVTGGATLNSVDPIRVGGSLSLSPESPASLRIGDEGTPASPSGLRVSSVGTCSPLGGIVKPGSTFTLCSEVTNAGEDPALHFDVEITGAFSARYVDYANCREPITVPAAAVPGTATIRMTARDASGRKATTTASLEVVSDVQTPTILAAWPAVGLSLAPNEGTTIGVDAWDDVAIASVTIAIDGQRTVLTDPPYRLAFWAPSVSSPTTIPVEIEVVDPSGNVARHSASILVVPAGAMTSAQLSAARGGEEQGLVLDGSWPYRDAPDRLSETVLPAIGSGTVTAVDGDVFSSAGVVWTKEAAGAFVEIHRAGTSVGRFRIEGVADEGRSLVLEAAGRGFLAPGDTFTGIWSFPSLSLRRGAHLVTSDVLEAKLLSVDSSSSLLARNLVIPPSGSALAACPNPGPIEPPAGLSPRGKEGWQ